MSVETREQEVRWDPEAAYMAFDTAKRGIEASQMRGFVEQKPDSEIVKRGVKVSKLGEVEKRVPFMEYIEGLEAKVADALIDLANAGGITAVAAYVNGRQGISYAGEDPVPHRNTRKFIDPRTLRL